MSNSNLLLDKKREALKAGILSLGEQVREALERSLDVLRRHDLDLARTIVSGDAEINHERRALEQQALVVLAAYRPAGSDLRVIGASLEMISEMERIADYAADIARILMRCEARSLPEGAVARCVDLGDAATAMFVAAMTAYARDADEAMARAAAGRDTEVDNAERVLIEEILDWIRSNPDDAQVGVSLLSIAHNYERVADRATNLAERVVYIATGQTPDLD
ncbi:phosphate signaling complex protein PhoU [Thiocapsa rosea]|uniref:Phosphate-specific transport system accessory protein PhoU n=1 Tax=Thiocapsa rosea TaxID=69360 RepID=A0A495VBQ3_9GAMM|nr:phosphate signaling complex protein PhoU [Thiocapsa rosea]RKT46704.1 phosphate transport system protein [Thiocapsa rosea]